MKIILVGLLLAFGLGSEVRAATDDTLKFWQARAQTAKGLPLADAKRILPVYRPAVQRITLPDGTSFVDPAKVYYFKMASFATSGPMAVSGDHGVIRYYVAPGITAAIDYQISPPGNPVNSVTVERKPLTIEKKKA